MDDLKEKITTCLHYIKKIEKSKAHGVWHSKKVLFYALELQKEYGGDKEVISIASVLHDFSRHFKHGGRFHGEKETEKIKEFLEKIGIEKRKIDLILKCIKEHSHKKKKSSLPVEAKIVSDADSLAGFGIEGLIRISMYAGERNKDIHYVIKKLCKDMREREKNLYFSKSKKIAKKLNRKLRKIHEMLCKNHAEMIKLKI